MHAFSDPILEQLSQKVQEQHGVLAPIVPAKPEQFFQYLSESIISQQLSTKVADVITARAVDLLGGAWSPQTVLEIDHEAFRAVGLSNAKTLYLKNLASYWQQPGFSPDALSALPDEEVITTLTQIKGIGRWTVEMFLIFGLARPDVFSAGDGGLQRAILRAYSLPLTTKPAQLTELAQAWAPHRSFASRVLWKSLESK